MCEVVRAETADLDDFVDRGQRYLIALREIFDTVAAVRSRTAGQMGAAEVPPARVARPFGGIDPLAEQIAESTLANTFVAEISAALALASADGAVGFVPAEAIDLALARAGLDAVGRDRTQTVDQELVEALAMRRDIREIIDNGSGLPDHQQGHRIGLDLDEYLDGLDGAQAAMAADVLLGYGLDLQAGYDRDSDDAPGLRTAATMLVTQGLLLRPGDPGDLVDELATSWVPTANGGRVRALSVLVDALDLEQTNDDLTIWGFNSAPWNRANQPYVRLALLSELITASHGGDGTLSAGGQRLVDDVLDRYPDVVELSAEVWNDEVLTDRYHTSLDGRARRVLPDSPLRSVLASALAAPNYGLDDSTYEAAMAIDRLDVHLAGDLDPDAEDAIGFERDVLIGILADGDPDRMMLIVQAMANGMLAADAVRLAHHGAEGERTDARVRRLRLVYDTNDWGDPVPIADVDPAVMSPEVARTLAAELGVLQSVQLARFAEGRPVPEIPLGPDQIELVERYAEVAPWFHHRFAWGWPGGAEDAVDYLKVMSDDELDRIFGDVPDGFSDLLDEIGRPENQVIWDLMAGASGNDTFLGPNGTYRPAGGDHVVSADAKALLVQMSLLLELGPYQELLDENGSGTIHEGEVERWLENARRDGTIPPALVDRVAIGATAGIGEDTFGWDDLAAIVGVVGLVAAVTATIVFSGGSTVPLWVQGGLVGLAAVEGYAAHRAGDNIGAVLAGAGGIADLAAAARLLRLGNANHARLVELANRSDLPALRALARQADDLSRGEFARRFQAVLDDIGYDEFLDVIATRSLDEQIEIVRNIVRIDQQFTFYRGTSPTVGHAAGRHGPHLSDEAMFARALKRPRDVSRWSSWDRLDDALAEAHSQILDEAYLLATRGTEANPINTKGWAQIDRGNVTAAEILTNPDLARWRQRRVVYQGRLEQSGLGFNPDGSTIDVRNGFEVVLRLDDTGTYRVLTAYPTP